MKLTEIQYKKWLNLSNVICSNEQMAQDILQDLLLYLLESDAQDEKLNDSYIFISLKNRFLKHINKEKKYSGDISIINQEQDELVSESKEIDLSGMDEYIDHQEIANTHQNKLKSIGDIVLSLREYEQGLYKLHFLYHVSQRKISRETGITLRSINNSINKIKIKIVDHHSKK